MSDFLLLKLLMDNQSTKMEKRDTANVKTVHVPPVPIITPVYPEKEVIVENVELTASEEIHYNSDSDSDDDVAIFTNHDISSPPSPKSSNNESDEMYDFYIEKYPESKSNYFVHADTMRHMTHLVNARKYQKPIRTKINCAKNKGQYSITHHLDFDIHDHIIQIIVSKLKNAGYTVSRLDTTICISWA